MSLIIAISGLSGVGKSVVSANLAIAFQAKLIKQDDYFLHEKPTVMLTNGVTVKNWDANAALDWNAFNRAVLQSRYSGDKICIVEGFALTNSMIRFVPDLHIHLSYIDSERILDIYDNVNVLISRVTDSRLKSKPGINVQNDQLMVLEIVIPYYLERLHDTSIDYVVPTFIGDIRLTVSQIVNRVSFLIERFIKLN